jgi:hypothetical protein
VFIPEHYIALKLLVAVHEAFSTVYVDKEVRDKTTNNAPTGNKTP